MRTQAAINEIVTRGIPGRDPGNSSCRRFSSIRSWTASPARKNFWTRCSFCRRNTSASSHEAPGYRVVSRRGEPCVRTRGVRRPRANTRFAPTGCFVRSSATGMYACRSSKERTRTRRRANTRRGGLARFEKGRRNVTELHYHDCDEFVFMVEGRCVFRSEGLIYTLEPGDVLVTRMGDRARTVGDPRGYDIFLGRSGVARPETPGAPASRRG